LFTSILFISPLVHRGEINLFYKVGLSKAFINHIYKSGWLTLFIDPFVCLGLFNTITLIESTRYLAAPSGVINGIWILPLVSNSLTPTKLLILCSLVRAYNRFIFSLDENHCALNYYPIILYWNELAGIAVVYKYCLSIWSIKHIDKQYLLMWFIDPFEYRSSLYKYYLSY
jgi:hypothetical protein